MTDKTIQITIDADWIDSLMNKGGDYWDAPNFRTAEDVLDMLKRHSDTLYDYIDDAILEMVDNAKKETDHD